MTTTTIAIIGDFSPKDRSHGATNDAISHSAAALGAAVNPRWVGTDTLTLANASRELAGFGGFWIAPASPYKNMSGALLAIRMAREQGIPLLGTCGGFQHIIIEYARNVLGLADAEHEETEPQASRLLISRLACSLVGRTMTITLQPDSIIARACGRTCIEAQYYCNFGVNPDYVQTLRSSALRIAGSDDEGVVRAVELAKHPFFVGTLFLPQHSSQASAPHPIVTAFIKASSHSSALTNS